MLPLAHLGHWLWVFYVIPVLIVIAGILLSSQKAKQREKGTGSHPDRTSEPAEPTQGELSASTERAPAAGGTGRDPENGGEAPARRGPSR